MSTTETPKKPFVTAAMKAEREYKAAFSKCRDTDAVVATIEVSLQKIAAELKADGVSDRAQGTLAHILSYMMPRLKKSPTDVGINDFCSSISHIHVWDINIFASPRETAPYGVSYHTQDILKALAEAATEQVEIIDKKDKSLGSKAAKVAKEGLAMRAKLPPGFI